METYQVKSMDMDNEKALQLFELGAKFVLLDAPNNLEFGIDFGVWNIGPKFMGVKFIPPGFHFIYYSSIDNSGAIGVRNGFFHNFKQSEILVKKWNPLTEDVFNEDELEPELPERIKINIFNIESNLGSYPLDPPELYNKWIKLTKNISPTLLIRILREDGKMEGYYPSEINPKLEDFEGSMRFTPINLKRSFPKDAIGIEVTKYALDKSYLLSNLIKSHFFEDKNFIGELELSFVSFLLGQNFSGLEQWKTLIALISNSFEAISLRSNLFILFLDSIKSQLEECPTDFFIDILLENNFLASSLQTLGRAIIKEDNTMNSNWDNLIESLISVQKLIKDKFHWELDFSNHEESDEEEEGEFAPVIVEL